MMKGFGKYLLNFFEEDEVYKRSSVRLQTFQAFHQCYGFSDYFPYESYEDGLYLNRSTIGFVFECLPVMGFTEESHQQMNAIFQYLLPEGSNIQFLLVADPFIGGALDLWQQGKGKVSPMLRKMGMYRCDLFKNSGCSKNPSEETPFSARFFRNIVSVTVPHKASMEAFPEIKALKERLQETLRMVGLQAEEMQPVRLMSLVGDLFFSQRNTSLHSFMSDYSSLDPIRHQLPSSTSLQVQRQALIFNEDEQCFKAYRIAKYPDCWSQMHMGELIGSTTQLLQQLPFPFFIHYGVHIPSQDELTLKILAKATHLEKQVHSPIAKHLPTLRKELDEYQFVKKQIANGHRFVRSSMTVALVAPPLFLTRADQMITNLYRAKGFHLRSDDFFHLQATLTLLPMSFGDDFLKDLISSRKLKTTISSESANLLPIQGEWYGTNSPGMLLLGRRGQVTFWSPFDNTTGNYNVSVVGRSGSGKSVFMQELMTSTLRQGGKVFVLDVGRSFEKTCLLLEGQFIEFTYDKPLCLNPFSSLQEGNLTQTEEVLSMLKSVLCTMAAPNHGVDDLEASYLEQAMRESFRAYKHNTTLTHIADWLGAHRDQKARDLGVMLYPYTKTGLYGCFFDGKATVDFNKPLVVLELEELKEKKDLQSVIVQMVVIYITHQMFLGNRQQPFMIVFDEAWDMLRGGKSGVFVETLARRLRKYNGSLVVGTQSVNDFYQSPGAQAAYENSDWLCLLSQKPESIHLLKENKRIHMSKAMEETLKSVHTKGGEYAECMIYGPHGYAVTRLILDEFSKMLYSTKATEYAAVKQLISQGYSIEEAVERVAKKDDLLHTRSLEAA